MSKRQYRSVPRAAAQQLPSLAFLRVGEPCCVVPGLKQESTKPTPRRSVGDESTQRVAEEKGDVSEWTSYLVEQNTERTIFQYLDAMLADLHVLDHLRIEKQGQECDILGSTPKEDVFHASLCGEHPDREEGLRITTARVSHILLCCGAKAAMERILQAMACIDHTFESWKEFATDPDSHEEERGPSATLQAHTVDTAAPARGRPDRSPTRTRTPPSRPAEEGTSADTTLRATLQRVGYRPSKIASMALRASWKSLVSISSYRTTQYAAITIDFANNFPIQLTDLIGAINLIELIRKNTSRIIGIRRPRYDPSNRISLWSYAREPHRRGIYYQNVMELTRELGRALPFVKEDSLKNYTTQIFGECTNASPATIHTSETTTYACVSLVAAALHLSLSNGSTLCLGELQREKMHAIEFALQKTSQSVPVAAALCISPHYASWLAHHLSEKEDCTFTSDVSKTQRWIERLEKGIDTPFHQNFKFGIPSRDDTSCILGWHLKMMEHVFTYDRDASSDNVKFRESIENAKGLMVDDDLNKSKVKVVYAMEEGVEVIVDSRELRELGSKSCGPRDASFSWLTRLMLCTANVDHRYSEPKEVSAKLEPLFEAASEANQKYLSMLSTLVTKPKEGRSQLPLVDTETTTPIVINYKTDHVEIKIDVDAYMRRVLQGVIKKAGNEVVIMLINLAQLLYCRDVGDTSCWPIFSFYQHAHAWMPLRTFTAKWNWHEIIKPLVLNAPRVAAVVTHYTGASEAKLMAMRMYALWFWGTHTAAEFDYSASHLLSTIGPLLQFSYAFVPGKGKRIALQSAFLASYLATLASMKTEETDTFMNSMKVAANHAAEAFFCTDPLFLLVKMFRFVAYDGTLVDFKDEGRDEATGDEMIKKVEWHARRQWYLTYEYDSPHRLVYASEFPRLNGRDRREECANWPEGETGIRLFDRWVYVPGVGPSSEATDNSLVLEEQRNLILGAHNRIVDLAKKMHSLMSKMSEEGEFWKEFTPVVEAALGSQHIWKDVMATPFKEFVDKIPDEEMREQFRATFGQYVDAIDELRGDLTRETRMEGKLIELGSFCGRATSAMEFAQDMVPWYGDLARSPQRFRTLRQFVGNEARRYDEAVKLAVAWSQLSYHTSDIRYCGTLGRNLGHVERYLLDNHYGKGWELLNMAFGPKKGMTPEQAKTYKSRLRAIFSSDQDKRELNLSIGWFASFDSFPGPEWPYWTGMTDEQRRKKAEHLITILEESSRMGSILAMRGHRTCVHYLHEANTFTPTGVKNVLSSMADESLALKTILGVANYLPNVPKVIDGAAYWASPLLNSTDKTSELKMQIRDMAVRGGRLTLDEAGAMTAMANVMQRSHMYLSGSAYIAGWFVVTKLLPHALGLESDGNFSSLGATVSCCDPLEHVPVDELAFGPSALQSSIVATGVGSVSTTSPRKASVRYSPYRKGSKEAKESLRRAGEFVEQMVETNTHRVLRPSYHTRTAWVEAFLGMSSRLNIDENEKAKKTVSLFHVLSAFGSLPFIQRSTPKDNDLFLRLQPEALSHAHDFELTRPYATDGAITKGRCRCVAYTIIAQVHALKLATTDLKKLILSHIRFLIKTFRDIVQRHAVDSTPNVWIQLILQGMKSREAQNAFKTQTDLYDELIRNLAEGTLSSMEKAINTIESATAGLKHEFVEQLKRSKDAVERWYEELVGGSSSAPMAASSSAANRSCFLDLLHKLTSDDDVSTVGAVVKEANATALKLGGMATYVSQLEEQAKEASLFAAGDGTYKGGQQLKEKLEHLDEYLRKKIDDGLDVDDAETYSLIRTHLICSANAIMSGRGDAESTRIPRDHDAKVEDAQKARWNDLKMGASKTGPKTSDEENTLLGVWSAFSLTRLGFPASHLFLGTWEMILEDRGICTLEPLLRNSVGRTTTTMPMPMPEPDEGKAVEDFTRELETANRNVEEAIANVIKGTGTSDGTGDELSVKAFYSQVLCNHMRNSSVVSILQSRRTEGEVATDDERIANRMLYNTFIATPTVAMGAAAVGTLTLLQATWPLQIFALALLSYRLKATSVAWTGYHATAVSMDTIPGAYIEVLRKANKAGVGVTDPGVRVDDQDLLNAINGVGMTPAASPNDLTRVGDFSRIQRFANFVMRLTGNGGAQSQWTLSDMNVRKAFGYVLDLFQTQQ